MKGFQLLIILLAILIQVSLSGKSFLESESMSMDSMESAASASTSSENFAQLETSIKNQLGDSMWASALPPQNPTESEEPKTPEPSPDEKKKGPVKNGLVVWDDRLTLNQSTGEYDD